MVRRERARPAVALVSTETVRYTKGKPNPSFAPDSAVSTSLKPCRSRFSEKGPETINAAITGSEEDEEKNNSK